mgnify:CR=1 FL=1
MPDLTGLEFAKMIPKSTRIIFTTAFNQYAIDGFKADALDYLLKPFDYTYDILIFERQLPAAISLVKDFPNQRFVIDHIAKPDIKSGSVDSWKKGIEEIAKYDNVWCKISGMVTEADWKNWKPEDLKPYLDVIFENLPADKILYGSDWPVLNVASDYNEVVKTLEDYISKFSIEDQNKIWFENAVSFYNLNE